MPFMEDSSINVYIKKINNKIPLQQTLMKCAKYTYTTEKCRHGNMMTNLCSMHGDHHISYYTEMAECLCMGQLYIFMCGCIYTRN